MLNLPEQYLVNKTLDIGTFLTTDLTTVERKKLKEVLLSAVLKHQIAGESIPSLLDEEYDVQVILFIHLRLSNMKHARFVADKVQRLGKPHTVLLLQDGTDKMCLSFAHKRLNYQDKKQVVLLDEVMTPPFSMTFDNDTLVFIQQFVTFDKLLNKSNKLALYIEMMTKCAVIGSRALWTESNKVLQCKIWYNTDKTLQLLGAYRNLEQYKREQKLAKTLSEQVEVNGNLRRIYQDLKDLTGLEYQTDYLKDSLFGKLKFDPDIGELMGEVQDNEGAQIPVTIVLCEDDEEPVSKNTITSAIPIAEKAARSILGKLETYAAYAAQDYIYEKYSDDMKQQAYSSGYSYERKQLAAELKLRNIEVYLDGSFSLNFMRQDSFHDDGICCHYDSNGTLELV